MKPLYDNSLPSGWNEKPLGQMVQLRRGYTWTKEDETDRPEEGAVPVIRIPNIQDQLELSDLVYLRNVSEDALEKAVVTKGWLLFIGSNGSQDRIGDSVLIEEDRAMVFASFLMGMTVKDQGELIPEFLANWMRMHLVREWFGKTSQQTTGLGNYSWSAVKKLPLRFPADADEQRRIAAVLKLADDAIAKVKAELEATRELKRSLMQMLFKNGIPPTKEKQLTKIGELPSRWKLKKGRELFKLYGSKAGEPVEISQTGECHYLKVDDFNSPGNEKFIYDAKIRFLRAKNPGYPTYAAGSIVFAKRGAALLKDRVRILGADSMIDPNLMVMECNEETISTDFMYHYLTYFRLGRLCEDAGIPQLNNRDLYPKYFPVPDEREQVEIVQALNVADKCLIRASEKVDALQQVKKSLLQNLLTGKIRIPEGVIHG